MCVCVFVIFTFCFYEIPKCNQNGISSVKNKSSTFHKEYVLTLDWNLNNNHNCVIFCAIFNLKKYIYIYIFKLCIIRWDGVYNIPTGSGTVTEVILGLVPGC